MNSATIEEERPLVVIVDDDEAVRTSLEELMLSVGIEAAGFGSTRELLEANLPERPGCLVLDVRMPGSSGLDLQQHFAATGNHKPIVFLTGHGDIPMTVQAMKAGAVDFLTKPFRDQSLLDAVAMGIERDVAQRADARLVKEYADRHTTLTPRERQVFHLVAQGRLNKQVAFELGITEVTVKLHRSSVMKKMEVSTIGELIRVWNTLPATHRGKAT
jgi:FixJ family two-component response regulator